MSLILKFVFFILKYCHFLWDLVLFIRSLFQCWKNGPFPFQYMKVRSQVWMHCVCVTSYPQTNGLSQLSSSVSCCQVILLHCLPLCMYSLHVCLCVYQVLSRPVLLFTVTVKLLSRVRPRLSAQVLLCFECDWKRSQRETEEMTEINWMYRGEGILKQILTESDRDLGSHSFLSVKVTWAITWHTDERIHRNVFCGLKVCCYFFMEIHAWKSCSGTFIEAYGEFKVFQIFTVITGARFHGLHVKWIHLGQTEDELKLQILITVRFKF